MHTCLDVGGGGGGVGGGGAEEEQQETQSALDFAPGDFVQLLTSEMNWAVAQVTFAHVTKARRMHGLWIRCII